ncbi:M16 family metallopeptidase [Macrococcus equipercicus]|uniref:Insulinase family protein n=1 Tax=Macrococcus equipercicus TaxID=69967 RepID=A0A9Q9BUG3_9STAP|nr:pitrilysin family protein [Macrococcus equipercicus]UTH14694.1 insulinase family protein [Macrococcus equipercicus]
MKLNNGLVVLDKHNVHQTVHIAAFVKVGTKNEEDFPAGTAHFMEHMLFKGTQSFTAQQLADEMDAIGGEVNAYTTKEYTCYTIKTLQRFEERAIHLLDEMLNCSTFPEEEVRREQQVILEEIKMTEDDPEDLIYEVFQEQAFSNTPFAVPILGTKASVGQIDREVLINFYSRFYRADHIIISYAGQDSTVLRDVFSRMTPAQTDKTAPIDYRFEPFSDVQHHDYEQAHLLIGYDAVGYHHPLYDAFSLFSSMFGESVSSPLFRRLREELGLCYNVYSSLDAYSEGGVFSIYIACDHTAVEEAASEIDRLLAAFKDQVTEEQLTRAKTYLITNAYMNNDYDGHIMMRNGQSYMYYGRVVTLEEFEAHIEAITLTDIHKVLQMLAVQPSRMTFTKSLS